MLAARTGDGRADVEPFVPSNDLGKWRLVAPLNANVQGQFATVKPLTLKSPDQFRTEGMPALTSAQYAAEFNEVKALGAQVGSSRTPAQTLMAGFYTANPLCLLQHRAPRHRHGRGVDEQRAGSPFRQDEHGGSGRAHQLLEQQEVLERLATSRRRSTKRRTTAIRSPRRTRTGPRSSPPRATRTSRPATTATRAASGIAPGSSSAPTSTRSRCPVPECPRIRPCRRVTPSGCRVRPGPTRGSPQVVKETIDGRILNGFHFRTADVHGAWIGKKTAQWIDKHYFAPVD